MENREKNPKKKEQQQERDKQRSLFGDRKRKKEWRERENNYDQKIKKANKKCVLSCDVVFWGRAFSFTFSFLRVKL